MIRAHLIGEVPITSLDLDPHVEPNDQGARAAGREPVPAPSERPSKDSPAERDSTVDEASDDSFPASDPPSFTSSRS